MKFSDADNPLVSVIIPVYNREKTLGRAVDSVLNQSYTNFELIIIDDCSTDNSLQIVHEFQDKRIRIITQEENLGANAARNRGIAEARGEYIAFQDSDDEWDKDKLQIQIGDMLHRNLAACYCAHRVIQGISERIVPKDYWDKEKYEAGLIDVLADRSVVSTQTIVVRKDAFSIVGNFDEEMPRFQDYEFVIRLVQKEKIGYIARPLVSVYRTAVSISTNTEALYKAIALLLIKHGNFLNFNAFLSAFLDIAISEKNGSKVYEECMYMQNIMTKKGIDINILEYALGHITQKWNACNCVQRKIYEKQMESLKTKKFAIYGAGDVAHEIYRNLGSEGIYPSCFLVTNNIKEESIGGIPVYTVDEWNDVDIMVIVGVASVLQNEIVDILLKKSYKHIICYPYL